MAEAAEGAMEGGVEGDRGREVSVEGSRRCSQAVLDFLSSTDVGRLAPPLEEEDAVSAVSEMEMQEWMEVQGGRAEEPGGAEAFLPMPDFMASAGTE